MKLKPGVNFEHKKKKYFKEIPDEIFREMYGNLGENEKESKKLYDAKVKKYKAEKEPVKDEPAQPSS